MKSSEKNLLILLKEDTIRDKELKAKIELLDNKAQKTYLWSTIGSVLSYLVLIIIILRIYINFNGTHPERLLISLISMYIFMGVLIFLAWKSTISKNLHFHNNSKTYIIYNIKKLLGQRKLTTLYLIEYAFLLGISCIFFFMNIQNGLILILKLTMPVTLIIYVLGLYSIINFTRQIKKLNLIHGEINKLFMKNIAKN